MVRYSLSSPNITLDLKQDFPGALTPATAGGKLLKTKKLRETLRVLY